MHTNATDAQERDGRTAPDTEPKMAPCECTVADEDWTLVDGELGDGLDLLTYRCQMCGTLYSLAQPIEVIE